MRNAEEIVLRALMVGQRVPMDDYVYVWQDHALHIVVMHQVFQGIVLVREEERLMPIDISLTQFIRECRKLSFDTLAGLAGNTALQLMAQERSRG